MKKFFNYAATLAIVAICAFGISACGNDDDDIKPGSMFGNWVSMKLEQNGNLLSFENDYFNGNEVQGTVYKVYGTGIMQNMVLNQNAITKIEKYVIYGTFSYSGNNLSITWPDGTYSGPIKFGNNGTEATWELKNSTLEMIRPTAATNSLQATIESLYQRYFAGK